MTEGERIVDLFLVKLVKDTKSSLLEKEKAKASKYGKSYNGNTRLWGTIHANRLVKGDNTAYQLIMQDYYPFVDKGRGAGNVSRSANISSWIKRKGINPVKVISEMRESAREKKVKKKIVNQLKKPSFAQALKQMDFIVRRKLTAKGYSANYFYSQVINDGRIERLKSDYKKATGKDLILEVKTVVGNGSNSK